MTGPHPGVKSSGLPLASRPAFCDNAPVYALLTFGLVATVILVLLLLTRNANVLFVASVRNGRLSWAKGRIPKRLARDLEDVLRARPVADANLRVIVRDRRPFVEARGDLREDELQRLRNVVGLWETARIRAAPFHAGPIER